MRSLALLLLAFLSHLPCHQAQEILRKSIYFESGKSDLSTESKKTLDSLIQGLRQTENRDYELELAAFTDDIGSQQANQALAQQRSNAVRTYLSNQSFSPSKQTVQNVGKVALEKGLDVEQQRRRNRRVDVVITAYIPKNMEDFTRYFTEKNQTILRLKISKKDKTRFKAPKGTWIELPADAFQTATGQPLAESDSVVLYVLEVFSLADMILLNAPTITDKGQPLETGGMVYLEARDQKGNVLSLRPNKTILLSFPTKEAILDGMELYLAERKTPAEPTAWKSTQQAILRADNVIPQRFAPQTHPPQWLPGGGNRLPIFNQELQENKITFYYDKFEDLIKKNSKVNFQYILNYQPKGKAPALVDPPGEKPQRPNPPKKVVYQPIPTEKEYAERYKRENPKDNQKGYVISQENYEKQIKTNYQNLVNQAKAEGRSTPEEAERTNRKQEEEYQRTLKQYEKELPNYTEREKTHDAYQDAMAAWLAPLMLAIDSLNPETAANIWENAYKDAIALKDDLVECEKRYQNNRSLLLDWAKALERPHWNKSLDSIDRLYPVDKATAETQFSKLDPYQPTVPNLSPLRLIDSLYGSKGTRQSRGSGLSWAYQNFRRDTARTLHWRSIAKESQQILYKDLVKIDQAIAELKTGKDVAKKYQLGLAEIEKYIKQHKDSHRNLIERHKALEYFFRSACEQELLKVSDLSQEYGNLIGLNQLGWVNVDRIANVEKGRGTSLEVFAAVTANTQFFLVFKDQKMVLPLNGIKEKSVFQLSDLPMGRNATVLGLRIVQGKEAQIFKQDIKLGETKRITSPNFERKPLNEIRGLINTL